MKRSRLDRTVELVRERDGRELPYPEPKIVPAITTVMRGGKPYVEHDPNRSYAVITRVINHLFARKLKVDRPWRKTVRGAVMKVRSNTGEVYNLQVMDAYGESSKQVMYRDVAPQTVYACFFGSDNIQVIEPGSRILTDALADPKLVRGFYFSEDGQHALSDVGKRGSESPRSKKATKGAANV